METGCPRLPPSVGNNMLNNLKKYEILLASASPRRRELLKMIGLDFTIASNMQVDESYPKDMPAEDVAEYISLIKAKAYRQAIEPEQLIITADTVVIAGNKILGKPANAIEAKMMLQLLSGNKHTVITGVTISTIEKTKSFSATTEVEFANLSDEEIDFYINTFRPLDKAGAYGIQEWIGCIGVKNINGSYYNVMGLPLHRLYSELKNF